MERAWARLVSGQAGLWVRELGRAGRCMEKAWARLGEWAGWRFGKA